MNTSFASKIFLFYLSKIVCQILSSNLLLLNKYFQITFQSLISKKTKLLNYSSMIHSESCSPRTFLTRKNSISKKKNKPSSVPVGFLNILSVPDPSGNYLQMTSFALTMIMYIKNIHIIRYFKNIVFATGKKHQKNVMYK